MKEKISKLTKIISPYKIENFNFYQINELLEKTDILNENQIKLIAVPEISDKQMSLLADLIKEGFNENVIKLIIEKKLDEEDILDVERLLTFEKFDMENIFFIVKHYEKQNILTGLLKEGIDISFLEENINEIENFDFEIKKLRITKANFAKNIEEKETKLKNTIKLRQDLRAFGNLPWNYYRYIYKLLRKGLTHEQISMLLEKIKTVSEMEEIADFLVDFPSFIHVVSTPELFNIFLQNNLFKKYGNFTKKDLLIFIEQSYFKNKIDVNNIRFYIDFLNRNEKIYDINKFSEIIELLLKSGISKEKITEFFKNLDNNNDNDILLDKAVNFIETELQNKIYSYVPEDLFKSFNMYQKKEILTGIFENLTKTQFSYYLQYSNDYELMKKIRESFKENLTEKQIDICLSFSYEPYNMEIIRFYLKKFTEIFIKKGYSRKTAEENSEKLIKSISRTYDIYDNNLDENLNSFLELVHSFLTQTDNIEEIKNIIYNTIYPFINFEEEMERISSLLYSKKIDYKEIPKIIDSNFQKNESLVFVLNNFMVFKKFIHYYFQEDVKKSQIDKYVYSFINFIKKRATDNFWTEEEIKKELSKIENEIKKYLKQGINKKFILLLTNPDMKYEYKKLIINAYKKYDLNENQIKLMILTNFKIPAKTVKNIDIKKYNGKISLILKKDIDSKSLNLIKKTLKIKNIEIDSKKNNIEIK